MASKEIVRFRPEHEDEFCFTQGRWVNDLLFLGGLAAVDEDGQVLHKGDLPAQMSAVYKDAAEILARCGLTLGDIVRETVYTSDMAAWRDTLALRREIFKGETPPPGSIIGVVELADPDMLIEIEFTARRRPAVRRFLKSVSCTLAGGRRTKPARS